VTKIQAVWHFVRAVLVGYLVGCYAFHILIDELVPIDVLIRWPYIEAGFVLSSFIAGGVLGFTPDRLAKGGLWVGGFFAFVFIALQTFALVNVVMVGFYMHHDRWQNILAKMLFDWTWRSVAILFCCALAGYCGQLLVERWKDRRGKEKSVMVS